MRGGEAKGAARGPPCASPQHIGAPHKAIPPKPSFLRETRGETRSDCCNGGGAPKRERRPTREVQDKPRGRKNPEREGKCVPTPMGKELTR